jgi:hypothetical protein
MDTLKLRTVKRQEADSTLTVVDFLDLKRGDKFRLYEPEGTDPLRSIENGEILYLAVDDAYPLKGSYAGIQTESIQTEPFTDAVTRDHRVVWNRE